MELGYQRWDDLGFIHWDGPVEAVAPHLDPRVELDTLDGRAWLSLTPFTLMGGRLRFMPPLPGISTFHEVNLRTYVRRDGVAVDVTFVCAAFPRD